MGIYDNDLLLAAQSGNPLQGAEVNSKSAGDLIGAILDLGSGTGPWSPGEPVVVEIQVTEDLSGGTDFGIEIRSDNSATPTTVVGSPGPAEVTANWVTTRDPIQVYCNLPGRYVGAYFTADSTGTTAADGGELLISIRRANDAQTNRNGVVTG